MHIGKITGNIVATRKDEKLVGCKLMIIQPLNSNMEPISNQMVAVDTVGAGIGDIIIYASGTAARIAAKKHDSPIDLSIIGIIDTIDNE